MQPCNGLILHSSAKAGSYATDKFWQNISQGALSRIATGRPRDGVHQAPSQFLENCFEQLLVGYPRFLAAVALFAGARLLLLLLAAGRFDAALFVVAGVAEAFRAEAVLFVGLAFRPVVDDLE